MLLFNRYQYQPSTDLIGRGELTRVYKALDKQIYLPVAVKIYRGNDPVEKFGLVNVKKFIAMDHPNICRYLHIEDVEKESPAGEKERTQVCVMELVPDGDFASYYRERKDPELLRKMVTDILRGLAYLHSMGIVHRRLKSSNLLVGETTRGPQVKITDFGLGSGKAALRDARLSSIVLEVTDMAPEQFNPRKYGVNGKVTYHVDFWQVGLTIYAALTNNDILFKNSPDDSREQVIQNILSPAPPEKLKLLPPPFDQVVARCLAKHADDRAQNTRELLELLSQPITTQDDVYETVVLPAMARVEAEQEEGMDEDGGVMVTAGVGAAVAEPVVGGPGGPVVASMVAGVAATAAGVAATAAAAAAGVAAAVSSAAPLPETSVPHLLFNRYEYNPKTGFIGKGGFSRVYKALDLKLSRWVALKLYKTGEATDRYSPFAEIRRVINLDHPNICRYLDIEEMEKENAFGEKEVTQICVMELLDGGNLLDYYTGHPTQDVLKKLLNDVLKGLEYLHKNGIIHRDIKPANILIKESYDGPVAKITDFGISKLSDSINQQNNSALVVSIPYMAPEQLNVKRYGIDEKIGYNLDLWSLGVTIYEIITGNVLFKNSDRDTSEQIMTNIMAPELPEKINELPQPFLDIVRRCVVKDARERAQTADELIELLHRPVVVTPVAAPVTEPVVVTPVVVAPVVAPEITPVVESVATPVVESVVTPVGAPPVTTPEMTEEAAAQDVLARVRAVVKKQAVAAPVTDEASSGMDTPYEPETPFEPEPWAVRPKRRRVGLRIAIVAVVVILATGLYIYSQDQRLRAALGFPAQQEDPANIGSGGSPATTPAAGAAGATPSRADSVKTQGNVVTGAEAEKKPHRARREHVAPGAGGATSTGATVPGGSATGDAARRAADRAGSAGVEAPKYVLLLSTPTTCTININNAPYGVLESGKTMKVYLSPGNYIIQATSSSDASAVYTGRLVVQEENLNQVGKYKIPL